MGLLGCGDGVGARDFSAAFAAFFTAAVSATACFAVTATGIFSLASSCQSKKSSAMAAATTPLPMMAVNNGRFTMSS
jgi:hypothetical protein